MNSLTKLPNLAVLFMDGLQFNQNEAFSCCTKNDPKDIGGKMGKYSVWKFFQSTFLKQFHYMLKTICRTAQVGSFVKLSVRLQRFVCSFDHAVKASMTRYDRYADTFGLVIYGPFFSCIYLRIKDLC